MRILYPFLVGKFLNRLQNIWSILGKIDEQFYEGFWDVQALQLYVQATFVKNEVVHGKLPTKRDFAYDVN